MLLVMLAEASRSRANERVLRAEGAVEPAVDVYGLMSWSYPGAFVLMAVASAAGGTTAVDGLGLTLLMAAKGLKYWAIATLGTRWTFRVLVPPGSSRVTAGPYRVLPHPNYMAVAAELAGFGLMLHAGWVGAAATLWFVFLMWRRVRVEESALAC
jgi:methyltransferase